ncbi:hypothetical protein WJX79_000556 [Trebouxia sp. C0005]
MPPYWGFSDLSSKVLEGTVEETRHGEIRQEQVPTSNSVAMWHFQRVYYEELPKMHICYTDAKPGYSWANIIELDDGWALRFSVNVNDHTIKLKPENEYVRLDTSDFDSLLEELTDFVHNQHSEAEHYSEAEQQILEVAPALEVEHALAALCEQAVSPRARSRTVKVKIEIDLTDETPQLKKVKVEQGCSSFVKQEPASSSCHVTES